MTAETENDMPSGYVLLAWNILVTNSSTRPKSEPCSKSTQTKEQKQRRNLKLVARISGCLLLVAYLWPKF